MKISIHQPAYNPWLGYIDKIIKSDVFVYLDTVQFEKNSFINRNKIKTSAGEAWLTVPVLTKDYRNKPMHAIEIDYKQNWIKTHLKSIELNYKKAPNFELIYRFWQESISKEFKYLSDLCFEQLKGILLLLEVKNKSIVKSSSLLLNSKKSDLILDICKNFNASSYLSGAKGVDYLELEQFASNKIDVEFQKFYQQEYAQLWGQFIPNLGVLDYLMNIKLSRYGI